MKQLKKAAPILLSMFMAYPAMAAPREAIAPNEDLHTFRSRNPFGGLGTFTVHYFTSGTHEVQGSQNDNSEIITFPDVNYPPCEVRAGQGEDTYDVNNAPDYIEQLACYLEYAVYRFQELGFNDGFTPPSLGNVHVVSYEYNGTSMPLNVPLIAGDILINSDIEAERLPTLVCHEMFHQFQYTYTTSMVPYWILEGTATWSEDLIFDEHNQYRRHINHYQSRSQTNLKQSSYDAVMFWRYLSEQLGPERPESQLSVDLMLEIWQQLAEGYQEDSINQALTAFGYTQSYQELFRSDFALANMLKDLPNALPQHRYDENMEAGYEATTLLNAEDLYVGLMEEKTFGPFQAEANSLHYFEFHRQDPVQQLRVEVLPDNRSGLQHLFVNLAADYGPDQSIEIQQGSATEGPKVVYAGSSLESLYVAVAVGERPQTFSLSISGN